LRRIYQVGTTKRGLLAVGRRENPEKKEAFSKGRKGVRSWTRGKVRPSSGTWFGDLVGSGGSVRGETLSRQGENHQEGMKKGRGMGGERREDLKK